jgi:hypothetical protein
MLKRYLAPALALMLSLFAQAAHAFIDPPYLTPEHPVAGETVLVNIRFGICDAIFASPQITLEGNAIRILFQSTSETDPILCNFPIGTGSTAVGAYPSGSYTLQVDRSYFDGFGTPATETLGILPFTVAGGAVEPAPMPTLDRPGFWILVLLLAALAAWALRSLRSAC